jgi:hypothetical protein
VLVAEMRENVGTWLDGGWQLRVASVYTGL